MSMKHVKVSLRTLLLSVMMIFCLAASSVKAEAVFPDEVDTGSETAMSDSEYTDIFSSEWYRNGYVNGLYRNRGLDHTVGFQFQNESISDIIRMSGDPLLLINGWSLTSFFDGTVFNEIDMETLKELQSEGIEDLGYLLDLSSYALANSYTLGATASEEYKNFSMDLYEDEHGTLYLLTLGEHTVYCMNYGKHSPKGTTYSKKAVDDYLTTGQQEVLAQCYLFWLYERNVEYGDGSLKWGTHTAFPKIASDSMYYLYMQICTWAAMKNCDFLGCIDAVRDAIIEWDSANSSWANGYYKAGESFYKNQLYTKYTVTMGVYSSGKSANQDMVVFDVLSFPPPPTSLSSKSQVTLTKTSNTDGAVTTAGFGLYEWNGTSYRKVEDLTHTGKGVYTSSIIVDCTTANQGKWRIAETKYPANHVQGNDYVDFNIAEELVKVFYRTFLERSPDSGGLSTWTGHLTGGMSEQEVMKAIAISSEATKALTNREYTKALYDLILFKTPTEANYTYWNTCLTDGTFTRATMFDFFWGHAAHIEGVLAGAIARVSLSYQMVNTKQGRIKIVKTSADPSITMGNSNYSLKGAVYGIYSDSGCKTLVGSITTDASGAGISGWLDPGTYYVKETKAPAGYTLDTWVATAKVVTNTTITVNSKEIPMTGGIKIRKKAASDTQLSLQGAKYGVYSDSGCTKEVTEITVDAAGVGMANGLPLGTYYVKEKTAPSGFALDVTVHSAKLTGAEAVTVTSIENLLYGTAYVEKENSDPEYTGTYTEYTLLGITFGLYGSEEEAVAATEEAPGEPIVTWTTTTKIDDPEDPSHTAYKAETERVELLPGIYYVKELSVPKGFYLNREVQPLVVNAGATAKVNVINRPKPLEDMLDKEVRIRIKKVDCDGEALSGSRFMIERYNETLGEWMHPYAYDTDPTIAALSNEKETDDHGEVFFDNLSKGKYRITETAAPEGYVLSAESIEVELPVRVPEDASPGGADYSQGGQDVFLTYELTVSDGQRIEMPFTGGGGIGLPVVGGILLALLGGSILPWKRKQIGENKS